MTRDRHKFTPCGQRRGPLAGERQEASECVVEQTRHKGEGEPTRQEEERELEKQNQCQEGGREMRGGGQVAGRV